MNTWNKLRLATILLPLMIVMLLTTIPETVNAAGPWYLSTSGNDGNDCLSPATACASINGALNKPGFVAGDTVLVESGTYIGAGNEVVLLNKNATLSGGWDAAFATQSSMTTIDGQLVRRGIRVGNGVTATVERFTIQNGKLETGGFIFIGGGIGIGTGGNLTLNHSIVTDSVNGGISNQGTLMLNDSTVSDNTNNLTGGGIDSVNATAVILNESTVSGNVGAEGGGIRHLGGGTVTLNNSTVSGNSSGNGGGIRNFSTLYVNNSTITGNIADRFASGCCGGGGIHNSGNTFVKNSIIAGNNDLSADSFQPDCLGSITSAGYNLLGNNAGCTFVSATGDQVGTSGSPIDPLLGPLQNNGGPTETHALQGGSPAIDAGNPAAPGSGGNVCLATDQRGIVRPQGATCDIGAFEFELATVVQVEIDIKPGNNPNSINCNNENGVIAVAILTTNDFDATTVDHTTVPFEDASETHVAKKTGEPRRHEQDVDSDGNTDLVLHFRLGETGLTCESAEGTLTGETFDGQAIEGTDVVRMIDEGGGQP